MPAEAAADIEVRGLVKRFGSAVAVGGVSGGAFNPAVGLGVFTMGLESVKQLGLYVVCDLAGAAMAALTYKAVNGMD